MDEELKNETVEAEVEIEAAAVEQSEEDYEVAAPEIDTEAFDGAEESVGNIKISVDVVSTIAGIATTEFEGVTGMYSSFADGIAEKFGARKSPSKGVKVEMDGETVSIDLYIVVEYGVRIPELAWEVQENVKNNVETMTGLTVDKVNIHIEGVNFPKEADKEEGEAIPELLEEPEE